MAEKVYAVLVHTKESGILEFAASINATETLVVAKVLVDMFRKYNTHTEDELKKAKINYHPDGGIIHVGDREYFMVTDDFVKQAPENVQQVYTDIIRRSADNELPC